jgi:Holliday junction DNA helicase RuvA
VDPKAQNIQDAVLALINLGYNQSTAQKAIKQSLQDLPETADLALLITAALKNI